jgi:hypothetical protein
LPAFLLRCGKRSLGSIPNPAAGRGREYDCAFAHKKIWFHHDGPHIETQNLVTLRRT